jgi:hypothetical protein
MGDAVELRPLKRLIIERTGGNPFFIEEMVQALFDEGTLVRNGAVKVTRSLSTTLAADGAGDTGGAHRSAVGGAKGPVPLIVSVEVNRKWGTEVEVEKGIIIYFARLATPDRVRPPETSRSLTQLSTDSWLKRHSEPTLNAGIWSLYRSR